MSALIRIAPDWLEKHAAGVREDVHLYWKGFFLARYWMWERLERLAGDIARDPGGRVLDAGGGMGLLLPTLRRRFQAVALLDLETSIAEKVRDLYQLDGIEIRQGSVLDPPFADGSFDAVVAAAFLEHFEDTDAPLARIDRLLKAGGRLYVDLPTENWVYRLGRRVGNIDKPPDHYHGAADIRPFLLKRFRLVRERWLPPRPFPLYYQAVLAKP